MELNKAGLFLDRPTGEALGISAKSMGLEEGRISGLSRRRLCPMCSPITSLKIPVFSVYKVYVHVAVCMYACVQVAPRSRERTSDSLELDYRWL